MLDTPQDDCLLFDFITECFFYPSFKALIVSIAKLKKTKFTYASI